MHIVAAFIIGICLFAGFHPIKENPKSQINVDIGATAPVSVDLSVKPLSKMQYKSLVQQTHDYSCGSAALATILNYYLGENFTESQVIQGLMEYGNKQKIAKRRAFSLLDMKRFVNTLGYKGVGYKAEMKDLHEIGMPCIIPIEFLGYRHFTVFRGFHGDHIFLADPFRGNTSYKNSTFKNMWYNSVIFVVYPEGAPTLSALELENEDLRYIHENSIEEILSIYGPEIEPPIDVQRKFLFTLPEEYQKYHPR